MEKRIFLAATKQNDGKTVMAVGFISAFMERFPGRVGFIKPVGQRYVEVDGNKIDEDSLLIHGIWDMGVDIQHMSPIAVERGFTAEYINSESSPQRLVSRMMESYSAVSKGKDIVVIEGTGHAGVGSAFDLSNANVAKLLGAKVVLVTVGGIGRPIDEIALNRTLFENEGVELIGVILNKVLVDKYDKVKEITEKGLKRFGMELLGVIPYKEVLSSPTIGEILAETKGELLNGEESLDKRVEKIAVGAMTPHQALTYFNNRTLVITPGDREDLIFAAVSKAGVRSKSHCVAGLILTGKILPHKAVMRIISKTSIPVIYMPEDTYSVASKLHDIIVKVHPSEKDKIRIARKLVSRYVKIDRILEKLG